MSCMLRKAITLCLSLVLFAAAAMAHGGEEHLMGTVTRVTDKSITIEDKDKKATEVSITADTKCVKGDAAATLKDVKPGDRIVIHAKKSGGKLVATMVRIGVAGAPTQKH
jgi:Cu/Ag efflux protein CusF